MGMYKNLKIKYNQHRSIAGWGLSVNAPADSLIELDKALSSEASSKCDITMKAFRDKVISSLASGIKEEKESYRKFKESSRPLKDLKKRLKFAFELRKRRENFAQKIDKAYEEIFDKAPRFTVGVMGILEKINSQKSLDDKDYKFLTEELEILTARDLGSYDLKEYLERMKNLINEFIKENVDVVKRIRSDLRYIIKQKPIQSDLDESIPISQPAIKQGPKVDEHGKMSVK